MDYPNELYSLTEFDPEGEKAIRILCAGDGLPQDRLVYADYHFTGWCGLSCQFRWASGRQDVWNVLDLPELESRAFHGEAWNARMDAFLENRETLRQKLIAKGKKLWTTNSASRTAFSGYTNSAPESSRATQ